MDQVLSAKIKPREIKGYTVTPGFAKSLGANVNKQNFDLLSDETEKKRNYEAEPTRLVLP